jgi:hypothetical protein
MVVLLKSGFIDNEISQQRRLGSLSYQNDSRIKPTACARSACSFGRSAPEIQVCTARTCACQGARARLSHGNGQVSCAPYAGRISPAFPGRRTLLSSSCADPDKGVSRLSSDRRNMVHPTGESDSDVVRLDFNRFVGPWSRPSRISG